MLQDEHWWCMVKPGSVFQNVLVWGLVLLVVAAMPVRLAMSAGILFYAVAFSIPFALLAFILGANVGHVTGRNWGLIAGFLVGVQQILRWNREGRSIEEMVARVERAITVFNKDNVRDLAATIDSDFPDIRADRLEDFIKENQ
jgi:uncharacterized protein (DUF433 family)